jgi:hypothetical protein
VAINALWALAAWAIDRSKAGPDYEPISPQ